MCVFPFSLPLTQLPKGSLRRHTPTVVSHRYDVKKLASVKVMLTTQPQAPQDLESRGDPLLKQTCSRSTRDKPNHETPEAYMRFKPSGILSITTAACLSVELVFFPGTSGKKTQNKSVPRSLDLGAKHEIRENYRIIHLLVSFD